VSKKEDIAAFANYTGGEAPAAAPKATPKAEEIKTEAP